MFENSKRKVGVFLDTQRDGKIKTSSFDLLNFVAQQKCEVFAFGSQTIKPGFLNTMGENGAQYFLDLGSAICVHESPDVYARTLASSIEKIDLDDFIAVAGQTGHDIVSRCAVLSNAPLLHNCVDVDLNNCVASKRIYAGMAHAEYAMPGPVNFYTVNPDILTRQKKFNFFPLAMDVAKSETKDSMEIISRTPIKHKNDILTAKTVFGGGLGFGSAAKFKEFQEATAQLNISVGATRSAVDAGYAPFSAQIGQTGHNISPDLYFAWGISGSIFHCAGFRGARVIVAINLDEQAQIFTKADFGIVEDMFKFFPALCDAIKNKTRV